VDAIPLTDGDQTWFYGLDSGGMTLHLWTAEKVEDLLSGGAAALRETYFGELVLSPEDLKRLHSGAVARIRARWMPETHQPVEAERALRRMLAGEETRGELIAWADELHAKRGSLAEQAVRATGPAAHHLTLLGDMAEAMAMQLRAIGEFLLKGDHVGLEQEINRPQSVSSEHRAATRALRSSRHPTALLAADLIADARDAQRLVAALREDITARLAVVLADAGCGKTHLAAQLTTEDGARPAGVPAVRRRPVCRQKP